MMILSALLGALLLYQLQNQLYRRFWCKNLTVDLSLSKYCAVEGEELILYETVVNKKLLPLTLLKVKFMTSKYLSFIDTNNSIVTDNYYRNDLLPIMMFQKLTRSLPFVCLHRGYYTIDSIDIVCSDIFLSFEGVESLNLDLCLYVYPKTVDIDKFNPPFHKMLGLVLTKRFINEDPFEFRSIREYQSYDTLKSVNWKAFAKTGSLKVNVNDYTSSQQVNILLNIESESIWKYEDLEEESIRLAASFATGFINQGIPTAVYTNARDIITKEIISIPPGSGKNHIKVLYETLSRIDTSLVAPAFVQTIQEECKQGTSNVYYIFISSYQKEDLQQMLTTLLQYKAGFSWIIPSNQEVKITAKETLLPYIVPWELDLS